jgi:SpoVK/Ycf46/Vps4 family AAA+-type ATPase
VKTVEDLVEAMVEYKQSKFKGRGVEFMADPDVPQAAGLELLEAALEQAAALLRPEAQAHHLTFPRGILLWGPPGTGKSLSAKLAASKMGVPLVSADWAGFRGATAYESKKNLKEFLDMIDALGEGGLILYFDDFDKGFSGFDANNDGGISQQLTGKLLTWMQEHTSKVCVVATVNRLGFLPPELIRRFEENIFFVDLPHEGARYEIFQLHLKKYFPNFEFTEQEWQKLLSETHLLTPAEIGNLVKRAASEIFYRNSQQLDSPTLAEQPLNVTLEDLIEQRYCFTSSMIRDEDALFAIRNQASFARPAAGIDRSKWARKKVSLFEGSH